MVMLQRAARLGALSLAFGVLGGGIGYFLLPERAPEAAGLPRVRVGGRAIDPQADPHTTALALARRFLREHITITADHKTLERSREGFGARVDVNLLTHLLRAANDPSSPMRRHHAALTGGPLDLPLPVRLDGDVALPLLMQLKEEVDHVAVDARIDVEARRVTPERNGAFLDVYGTLARLDQACATGRASVAAVVEHTRPSVTASQLRNVRMDAVLGWFQTSYNANEDHRDRTYNLHLAASKLNGYVWMPGQEFDFNAVVGDRSEANGFRMATVISAGELIDGVGGGTCQVAGTLYAASFFAGMEVLDRSPHSRPSGYIKMGLDATVVYPSINLKMRNNLPFPVVIHTRLGNGSARIELLGATSTRSVSFVRKILPRVDRFEEREVPDANLPLGQRVLTQRGIPGFRIMRYRFTRIGDQWVRERWQDAYPPTTQIWHVGTGPASAASDAQQDSHPEYTADQYLSLTLPEGGGRMQEVRRPGFCGSQGWMERQGLVRRHATPTTPSQPSRAAAHPRPRR